jgi:hypothetical protein
MKIFKGKYIDIFLTCNEGTKAVHIVANIPEKYYDPAVFFKWIKEAGLTKKHYEEDRIEGTEDLKVELVAFLDANKEEDVKTSINELEQKLGVSKENIYVSEISSKLIIDSSPYLMTSSISGEKDLLLPIFSRKHFIRSLDDLILESGHNVIVKLTGYYYTNGLVYLGQEYLNKCHELSLDPRQIADHPNTAIIHDIFRSTYSAEITHISKREVEGKTLIKIQVKDHFFLYHPTCESRIDVHNHLISPIINLNVRNCALMREIFAGFFEKIFYGNVHDLLHTAHREDKMYYGFEFDYFENNQCMFDFESSNWKPVSTNSKINIREFNAKRDENHEIRKERCKSVNLLTKYKIFVDKRTREILPWNNIDLNDPNILPIDYLSLTLLRVGNETLRTALSFGRRDEEDFYNWLGQANEKFFYFFFSEKSAAPKNSEYVKREPDPEEDFCTFYFYDKEFISYD